MKSEPKAFASLSSGLLARKGAARPAMRPQGFGQAGSSLEDLGWNDMGFEPPRPATVLRDAAHDAFGDEVDADSPRHSSGLTPLESPVHHQQARIVGQLAANRDEPEGDEEEVDETAEPYDPKSEAPLKPMAIAARPIVATRPKPAPAPVDRTPRARPTAGAKGKAAFTLRLDPERHLKLRLACAVRGMSAQLLVTEALDALLEGMPELDGMADKAKRKD